VKLSRRTLLTAAALAALPALPVRAAAARRQRPAVGELWGMPYYAPGALGSLPATVRRP
jgi:hypothetical protein